MAILVLYNLSIHPTNKAIIEFVLVNRSSPILGSYFTLIRMFSCTSHDLQSISIIFLPFMCVWSKAIRMTAVLRQLKV